MSSSVVLSVDMPIIAFEAATSTVFRIVSLSRPSTSVLNEPVQLSELIEPVQPVQNRFSGEPVQGYGS